MHFKEGLVKEEKQSLAGAVFIRSFVKSRIPHLTLPSQSGTSVPCPTVLNWENAYMCVHFLSVSPDDYGGALFWNSDIFRVSTI